MFWLLAEGNRAMKTGFNRRLAVMTAACVIAALGVGCKSVMVELKERAEARRFIKDIKAAKAKHPAKFIERKTVECKFTSIITFDYVHFNFKLASGEDFSSWGGGGEKTDYFILKHPGVMMSVTYSVWNRWIWEGNEYVDAEEIESAKIGSLTPEEYWRQELKKRSKAEIKKEMEKLEDAFNKIGDDEYDARARKDKAEEQAKKTK
jgi:hypothetical protein